MSFALIDVVQLSLITDFCFSILKKFILIFYMTICKQTLEYLTVSVNNGTFLKRKIYLVDTMAAARDMAADVDELREKLRVLEARDEKIIAILRGEDEERSIPQSPPPQVRQNVQNALSVSAYGDATAVLNAIDDFCKPECGFKENNLYNLNRLADTTTYINAPFFQEQVRFAFFKLIQQKASGHPRIISFDEVRTALVEGMKKQEQIDRQKFLTDNYRLPPGESPMIARITLANDQRV